MSASPANPSGPTAIRPATGGPGPAPVMRKKAAASIFNPKKKLIRKPLQAQTYTASGQVPASGQYASGPAPAVRPATYGHGVTSARDDDPNLYTEYPIIIQKSALTRGIHHHAFKLPTGKGPDGQPVQVNPYDPQQFTRPVRLHRRLARDKPEGGDQSDAGSGVDDKEREQRETKKAERQAEREANQALIAPTGEVAVKKQIKRKQQKKVEDVYYNENNPKQKARSQLRYEEARPWHLEDFDGKNKWIGSYEEPLSRTNVMLEVAAGGFKMIPVEKWYKMVRSDRVNAMDMDQIEKIMAQQHHAPRWFMGSHEAADDAKKAAYAAKREQVEQARRGRKQKDEDEDEPVVKQEDYRADIDEIDFEFEGEFQDDDEGFIFGDQGEDDVKDIERKIRKEMRSANLAGTGVKDEDKDYDSEEKAEKLAKDDERKKQKKLRRKLKKKELRHEYESDTDDENKYEESSDSEDSEEEREREEEERKKKEEEEAARPAGQASGGTSGASTKGNNTPNGRSEKKPALGASLKRDAELSELSGNESSRKKVKLNGSGVPKGARALSPDAAKRIPSGYGSGSDTDTSRAGRTKLRLKNSPPGSPHERTPNISRPGSPSGSRAQSPAPRPFPSLEEVKAAIPMGGVAIGDLVKSFKTRLGGRNGDFIALVKQAGKQDHASKKIVPKD
ncbi:hypothetical protein LTR36_007029 [Oleoguttula mirabilis]|uniref:Transcription initiation factor IIF subunit alpha n=1 Tax=Oleoguttula mirabilis TaxID=1507867 RepID=A0AAV9JAM4_9PEZI|nr:hypothetical protein LTR36_007029 [Oleoguttula mirabilis]